MGSVFGKIVVEVPAHEVIHKAADYEVRRYGPAVAATVRAASLATEGKPTPTDREFQGQAFRALARYIGVFSTPENKSAATQSTEAIAMTAPVVMTPMPEKVAMTAPVVMGGQEADESMTFMLPAKYTRVEDAPVPQNPAVTLSLLPGDRCEAVLTYSGNITMATAADQAKTLLSFLERDGVTATGAWTVQGYNSPFVLPWYKTNEIHIPIAVDSIKNLNPPTAENSVEAK